MLKPQETRYKIWNDLGFWQYKCGCIQYQDGWEYCNTHRNTGYIQTLMDNSDSPFSTMEKK